MLSSPRPLGRQDMQNLSHSIHILEQKASAYFHSTEETFNELQHRIQRAVEKTEPYSLVRKELEEVVALIETKKTHHRKMFGVIPDDEEPDVEKRPMIMNLTSKSLLESKRGSKLVLEESIREDGSEIHRFRSQGRELLDEYKSVLHNIRQKNQALQPFQQPPVPQTQSTTHANITKSGFSLPNETRQFNQLPGSIPTSPIAYFSDNNRTVDSVAYDVLQHGLISPKGANLSYGGVLKNIEDFVKSFEQKASGQNRKIDTITREINSLKDQISPYKQYKEMKDLSQKLDEQCELLEEKHVVESRTNIDKFLNLSIKDYWQSPKASVDTEVIKKEPEVVKYVPEKPDLLKYVPEKPEIYKSAQKLNAIHTEIDNCEKLLVRKRLDHASMMNAYKSENNTSTKSAAVPLPQAEASKAKSPEKPKLSDSIKLFDNSDFDVRATLSRRESRMKSYQEREERMALEKVSEKEQDAQRPELAMTQTLKRSNTEQRPLYEYYSSGKDKVVYVHGNETLERSPQPLSKTRRREEGSMTKSTDDLGSGRKSCLMKKGDFNSKENSAVKAERKIRFADEENSYPGRALHFDDFSEAANNSLKNSMRSSQVLETRDLNGFDSRNDLLSTIPAKREKKTVLKGQISKLDKEIQEISHLLNSALSS